MNKKNMLICIADDCETSSICKNLCKKHYNRFLRHGDFSVVKGSGPKRIKNGGKRWVQTFRAINEKYLFGKCPGCKKEVDLVFDHDHSCCVYGCIDCFRGFLCASCNHALGYAKDTPEVLRRLANYLESKPNLDNFSRPLETTLLITKGKDNG